MNHRWCTIFLILWAGCARPMTRPGSDAPAFRAMGQSVAAEETRSDETIGFEMRHRLTSEIPGESAGVVLEVSDAIVTLRGYAPSQAAVWRVEAIAHSVKGVKGVHDELVVRSPPPLP